MVWFKRLFSGVLCVSGLAGLPSQGRAADPSQAGVIAALGLQAADGKTTLAGGAGAIEASLLMNSAVDTAGGTIAGIVDGAAPKPRTILVLSRTESISLSMFAVYEQRLNQLRRSLPVTCKAAGSPLELKGGSPSASVAVTPSDVVAAFKTDVAISPISIAVDDRVLVNSILRRDPRFRVPSEIVASRRDSAFLSRLLSLQARAAELKGSKQCQSDPDKTRIANAEAFVSGLLTPDKDKGGTPLASLLQLEALGPGLDDPNTGPYILRVAVEQVGGTAITKNNIWHALGFPGAATVTSGMIVGFRLVNPWNGSAVAAGTVRCAVRPTSFSNVARLTLAEPNGVARCSP